MEIRSDLVHPSSNDVHASQGAAWVLSMSLRIPQIQRLADENFQKVFMEAQEAESLGRSLDVAMRR